MKTNVNIFKSHNLTVQKTSISVSNRRHYTGLKYKFVHLLLEMNEQ